MLDLIVLDRLRHLQDENVFRRLQLSAEVPVSIRAKDVYGNDEIVKGRADWALGYGRDKIDTGSILLMVEAKPYAKAPIGMPQLLVYMAAVHDARKDKINESVFGMLSDSEEFHFAFLDPNKKFFTLKPFLWRAEKATILAYLDMILLNAIESSPHTTSTKVNNKNLLNYASHLNSHWRFGTDSDEDASEGESDEGILMKEDEDTYVQVFQESGLVKVTKRSV